MLLIDEDNFQPTLERDDQLSKGVIKKGRPTLRGTIDPKRDDQPMGQRIKQSPILTTHPLGFPWGLRGVHSHILTWKLLAHHDQRPNHAIRSLIYGKVIPSISEPFSLQGNSPRAKGFGSALNHYINHKPYLS